MRIALVTYGLHVGGMESFLFMLAEGLRARGDQVTFVITEEIGAWHQRARGLGFDVVSVLPSPWRGRRWQAQRLKRRLQDFDVVLLNHTAIGQAVAGELPDSCLVVAILHNDYKHVYRIGLENLSNVDYVVAVGSKIAAEARRLGAGDTQLRHIPYGVKVPEQWPRQDADFAPSLKLLFVGRIENTQKGVFDIPPILAKVKDRNAEFTIEIVGDGNKDLPTLKRLFAELLPECDVLFHGRKDHPEVVKLMAQSDVLLMPSRFEGLPITLLEALAQGLIPVASNLPGVTDDAVDDGRNGLLCPVGDINRFAEAIVQLEDPVLRRSMSHEAWRIARSSFTKDSMLNRYFELLGSGPRVAKRRGEVDRVGRRLLGLKWILPHGLVRLRAAVRRYRSAGRPRPTP